jgi:nucleotide-binding universal stress UspA family protein
MHRRIVVGTDDSEGSRAALRWAVREAELRRAELVVVRALTYVNWMGPGLIGPWAEVHADLKGELERSIAQDVARASEGHSHVMIVPHVEEGTAAKVLIDVSKGADLLVVGSHGRGGFAGMMVGSVSQQVTQHAYCPVVVVR